MPILDVERKRTYNLKHNRCHTEEYRRWMSEATAEQKRLWKRLKQIDTKPEHRAECMEIYKRLQEFVPITPNVYGGKYGRSIVHEHEDGEEIGMKMHLVRRMF